MNQKEIKIRCIIMLICGLISTMTVITNEYYGNKEFSDLSVGEKKIASLMLDDWSYNPYDNYQSKLEIFIIIMCGFISILMMVDILLMCHICGKNINSSADKYNKHYKFLEKKQK